MTRTIKKALTVFLLLCLTMALGAAALASGAATAPTEVTPDPKSVTVGVQLKSVTLTATDGSKFVVSPSDITIAGAGVSAAQVTASSSGDNKATLTIENCTPTETGTLTIEVPAAAFEQAQPSEALKAEITVTNPTGGSAEASFSGGTLTAGQEASGTITVTVKGDGYVFKETGTLATTDFSLGGTGATDLSISAVSQTSDTEASLTLSGTPKTAGPLTVTVNANAFKYPPSGPISDVNVTNGTVKAADNPTVTASASSGLVAGTQGTIELSIDGVANTFVDTPAANLFTLTSCNSTNPSQVSGSGQKVTLTVTPTNTQGVTVSIDPQAFTYQPENSVSCASVSVSAPTVTATASGTLTQGVEGGKITVTINGENDTFKSNLGTSYEGMFTVNVGDATLEVTGVERAEKTATLTMAAPTTTGTVSVKINKTAFTYEAATDVTAGGNVTVSAPTISATASGGPLTVGVEGEITIQATGGDFASESLNADWFTLTGGGVTHPTSVTATGSKATLKVTPKEKSNITGISINNSAFKFTPASQVTTSDVITVNAPTGTLKAEVTDGLGKLYNGTQINGEKIKLSFDPGATLKFKSNAQSTDFTLNIDSGDSGLTVDSVAVADNAATLTISGTPSKAGTLTITAKTSAFEYPPDAAPTATITVNPAPTVTLNGTGIVAGNTDKVVVTISGGDAKFVSEVAAGKFTISGSGFEGLTVSEAKITDGDTNKTVELTLSAAPTTTGTLTVTVDADAFTPVAASEPAPKAEVTVSAPEGTVTGELAESKTLTAGVDATGTKITLKIGGVGTLNFKNKPGTDAFTLDSGTGDIGDLKVSDVTYTGPKEISLSLTGTPKAGGTFTVTVNKEKAFVAAPTADVTAITLNINYPTVTLKASPNRFDEGEDTVTITLTAGGSSFKAVTGVENFSIAGGVEGVTLESVQALEGSTTATLTLKGPATSTGSLTVTAQPAAFLYAPQNPVTSNEITVGPPEGSINGTLNGTLYAGTPVNSQTITLTVVSEHGLHFDPNVGPDAFQLDGTGSAGLQIAAVTEAGETATLTLSGTPTTAGDFTVTALKDSAFKQAPAKNLTADGTFTVQPAPSGTVTAAPSGPLYAGTSADGTTVTLTADGLTFQSGLSADKFTLTGADGLTIKSVSGSGSAVTLTLSGTPKAAGAFTIAAAADAFVIRPSGAVTSSAVTVGAANIKLTVSDNGLQAGKKDMTFTVTPSGGKLIDLANRAAAIDTGEDLKGLTLGDMTQNADGSVTVTVMGMPPVAGSVTLTLQPSMFDPQPAQAVSVTVPVAEGEQAAEPETKPGAPGIGFTAPVEDLASAVLTPEEQALYEKGAQVLIELVESPGAQVPEADKTAVAAAAGDYTVGEYLDVSLIKTINGVSGTVSETSKPIQVVFTIPEDLRASGRQFAVIRVHEGKAELLKTVASTATTITVESDLFSTYAIVYQEAPASTDKPDATDEPDATDKPDATPAPTTAPHTGDETPLLGWTALLLGCAAALVLTTAAALRRRRDRG